ncbi:unnamed protein product [Parascedosporium putredinis]|uniref:propanoyl-CoA C-acyltransferase n=1 Tax=Parascedosporium putredinis TaxID=1442378 RepID=A0A9P1H779_9PEZI|nr:unnamed protein product [Parascedosporium putredinis]CAI8001141.1 unnamed protein product [Parascedosporium putredinis]
MAPATKTPKAPPPVYVLGVGMTKFLKPGSGVDYPEMGLEAGVKALLDAHITYDDVESAVACYCYGDSTCGQRVVYQLGMTQIPVYNDCVFVVGFEKMMSGSLKGFWDDRASPLGPTVAMMAETRGVTKAPGAAQMFGNAGREYMEKYGAKVEDFAEIARINHAHSPQNPYSQFQDVYSLEQVLASPKIHEPLTKLQCCPTSDGAAAAVLVSQAFLDARPHLRDRAILVAGQALTTDAPSMYNRSAIDLMGYDMTKRAANIALSQAGISPADVQVVELHDCFSANEMVVIEALGLSSVGKAHELVRAGDITYGGKYVVNPSGGLISKGHPLGATGIAQCAELVWHLRGWANNRAVGGSGSKYASKPGTKWALQHNLGLGGAAVVTVYGRADGKEAAVLSDADIAKVSGVGYNPAVEARGVTEADLAKVASKEGSCAWARQAAVKARF